jgi:hypothetical protein
MLKCTHKKGDWNFGPPPGSEIYMKPQKAYTHRDLLPRWFEHTFVPRKALEPII